MIEILFEENNKRVAAYDEGNLIGKCTYFVDKDGVWNVDHTIVEKEYGGLGLGGKLFSEVITNARLKGKKINPICSFAVAAFEKNKEYRDVLNKL